MIPHVNESKKEFIDDCDEDIDYSKVHKVKWYHYVLLNSPLKVAIVLFLAAFLAPVLIYQFMFASTIELQPSDNLSIGSCVLPREARLTCGNANISDIECHSQCCYDYTNHMCFHRFPSRFSYIIDEETGWNEEVVLRPRISTEPFAFQRSLTTLGVSIDDISASHMSITYYNSSEMSLHGARVEDKLYSYRVAAPELNIEIEGPQGVLFTTMRGPLIASDDIWEVSFTLTNETMYGLGEIPLIRDTVKVIYNHGGDLSSIPLIFAKYNGSYHGLLIDIVAPTEVSVKGNNQIVVRSITNSGMKFHVFVGPRPKDVMNDVLKLTGYSKKLEYWMLGAHICSDISQTLAEAYSELTSFTSDALTENLPYESHCGTKPIVFTNRNRTEEINYMEMGAEIIKNANKRFIPHVSPYIRYEELNETSSEEIEDNESEEPVIQQTNRIVDDILYGYEELILRKPNLTSEFYKGLIEDFDVIYPNYGNISMDFMTLLWAYNSSVDGIVLENSWPLDETVKLHNETVLFLPYFSQDFKQAFNFTPQWNVTLPDGQKYFYKHNEYGNSFGKAFKEVFDTEIPLWSTSQWMNSEVIINRQSIDTSWTNLRRELTTAALGGISGHWLWSTPICGDTENFDLSTHTNLCVKWYMAATYMPMIKVHSKSQRRDPLSLIGINKVHAIESLRTRLVLLPYFFTTLQKGPLLRPMFYQFPSMEQLENLSTQFSVGEDLLIVPNLQPSQSHVHFWMPNGTWYEFWSGLKIEAEEGEVVTMTTTDADFFTLVRGGSIIVMQKDVQGTAEETRLNSDYSLTIALYCYYVNVTNIHDILNPIQVRQCEANGELYLNENLTFNYEASQHNLTITATGDDFESICDQNSAVWSRTIKELNIYGLNEEDNNYDTHKHVTTSIDMCVLENNSEEVYLFS